MKGETRIEEFVDYFYHIVGRRKVVCYNIYGLLCLCLMAVYSDAKYFCLVDINYDAKCLCLLFFVVFTCMCQNLV